MVYLKGLGFKDRERQLPATPDTRFGIGSCTKAFTAMLAVMAQDDGKLRLDDPPRKYLPYFKLADPASDAGLQNYVTGPGLPAGIKLPAGGDTGKMVGALLGQVLMVPRSGSTRSM